MVRFGRPEDWKAILDIHRRAGYGFALPDPGTILSPVVVEEAGHIIAVAGLKLTAEVVAVVEPLAPPEIRLWAISEMYKPLAELVLQTGIQTVYAFADPKYKNFDRRLMRSGWSKKLWPCMFLEREEIENAYGKTQSVLA